MSGESGPANLAAASALVDELLRCGLHQAVICPGSRSTPLALALAMHESVRFWVQVDERSAAFFALGMARQLREPVAVLSTSGTAAANFYPAVAEAKLGRVPLLVLTADRPPELRDWGAAQTIDQLRLYGEHAKWFVDMPVPDDNDALLRQARAVAARAIRTATLDPAGPVHLNFPFREPLLPPDLQPPLDLRPHFARMRSAGERLAPDRSRRVPDQATIDEIAATMADSKRGLIVCGPGEQPGLAPAATSLASASGYPILADPLSGLRFGSHDRSAVLDAYDPLLRVIPNREELRPDVVVRFGAIPTSKPLQEFLAMQPARNHVLVDPGEPRDPFHLATEHVPADPPSTLRQLAGAVRRLNPEPKRAWLDAWVAADRLTATAIRDALALVEDPFEGRAAAEVAALVPDGGTLVVGNSMPVRDVDAFVRGDHRRLRIVANRGANGIDGVVSSALGAAAVGEGPTVALVGDLSFYHDLNGLLAGQQYDIDATIVVLNNDGGGIFSFLPQAEQIDAATFEALFGTPTGLNIATAARLYRASYSRPDNWHSFRHELCLAMTSPGISILEHVTDRKQNVAQHRAVWAAVRDAILRSPQAFA